MDWIDQTLEVIRISTSSQAGWQEIMQIVETTYPSAHWRQLPSVNMDQDIADTQTWLVAQLTSSSIPQAIGIYLGLDTLNMDGPDGYNLELGTSQACNVDLLDSDWLGNCSWYGEPHLIRGLQQLKAGYDQPQWRPYVNQADYIIPLGYSGLILTAALAQMSLSYPTLIIWGFHDGDLFFLGRHTTTTFEKICKVI